MEKSTRLAEVLTEALRVASELLLPPATPPPPPEPLTLEEEVAETTALLLGEIDRVVLGVTVLALTMEGLVLALPEAVLPREEGVAEMQ